MRWWVVVMLAVVVPVGGALAAPFAWLAHDTTNKVARVDLATHETESVAIATPAFTTAASLDGLRAYTTSGAAHTVSVIDATSMTVVATVPMPGYPTAVAVRADGAKAYVPLADGGVTVIDTATNTVLTTIPLTSAVGFGAIVTNAAGTRMYVTKADYPQTSVAVINTLTDTVTADVLLNEDSTFPLGVAVSADGTRVYATAYGAPVVYVINGTTNLFEGNVIPLSEDFGPPQPNGLAVSSDGTRVYATDGNNNRLAVLDAVALTEIASVPVGAFPTVVDLTPDGSRAYVVNSGSSSLTVVDTATNTVIGTVLTVDDYPSAGERFIAPGTTTTTTSTTLGATTSTSTTATSTSTSTTIAPPPILSPAALACQKTLAVSFKRFAAKSHAAFVTCFQRLLAEVAAGNGTTAAAADCLADLDPSVTSAKINKLRTVARSQIVARCASVGPGDLGSPCDPVATTMAETADCVLGAQLARVTQAVAAEYGNACGVATAAGLAGIHPGLCVP